MEKQILEEFEKEIETLKKIIEGYISKNEILASLELDSLSLKFPEVESEGEELNGNNDKPMLSSATIYSATNKKCKICLDGNGKEVCYYGPGDCPN